MVKNSFFIVIKVELKDLNHLIFNENHLILQLNSA
jgi:hypothetical protein